MSESNRNHYSPFITYKKSEQYALEIRKFLSSKDCIKGKSYMDVSFMYEIGMQNFILYVYQKSLLRDHTKSKTLTFRDWLNFGSKVTINCLWFIKRVFTDKRLNNIGKKDYDIVMLTANERQVESALAFIRRLTGKKILLIADGLMPVNEYNFDIINTNWVDVDYSRIGMFKDVLCYIYSISKVLLSKNWKIGNKKAACASKANVLSNFIWFFWFLSILPFVLRYKQLGSDLNKKVNAELYISTDAVDIKTNSMLSQFRNENSNIAWLQYGLFVPENTIEKHFIGNYFLVFGQYEKRILNKFGISSDRIKSIGNPRLTENISTVKKNASVLKRNLGMAEEYVVTYISVPFVKEEYFTSDGAIIKDQHSLMLAEILDASKKLSNVAFVVRPHPEEYGGLHSDYFSGCKNIYIDKLMPINDVILDSDIIITLHSTVAMQAIILNKRIILLDLFNLYPSIYDYYDSGMCALATREAKLVSEIKKAIKFDVKINESKKNKYLADHFEGLYDNAINENNIINDIIHDSTNSRENNSLV